VKFGSNTFTGPGVIEFTIFLWPPLPGVDHY